MYKLKKIPEDLVASSTVHQTPELDSQLDELSATQAVVSWWEGLVSSHHDSKKEPGHPQEEIQQVPKNW